MSEVVKADLWQVARLKLAHKVVCNEVGVKGFSVFSHANIAGILIIASQKPLIFVLPFLHLQKIGPHRSHERQLPAAGSCLGIVRVDDRTIV